MGTYLPTLVAQSRQLWSATNCLQNLVARHASGPAADRTAKALVKAAGWLAEAEAELTRMIEAEQAEARA